MPSSPMRSRFASGLQCGYLLSQLLDSTPRTRTGIVSTVDPVVWNLIGARKYSPERISPSLVYSTQPFWPVSLAWDPIAVRATTRPRDPVSILTILSAPPAMDTASSGPSERVFADSKTYGRVNVSPVGAAV